MHRILSFLLIVNAFSKATMQEINHI